ncbi:MAG: hypothetical protein HY047_19440 [Acidobacteria bacterium]|nr:hypothetical protein [Acidobacteriota bacterium]
MSRWLIRLGVLGFLCALAPDTHAQLRRPKADVTPLVETDGVRAGSPTRLALSVSLPEGLHTQSNTPRDPLLIPTALTIDAPSGVTVSEIVFPPSTDLKQAGQDQPLAVFEHEFAIGVQLALASTVAAGDLVVPAHLRYQACDANLCYPPATADFEWKLRVVTGGRAATPQYREVFDKIAFGRGKPPAAEVKTEKSELGTKNAEAPLAKLDGFTVLGTSGGYLGADEFLKFIHNARRACVASCSAPPTAARWPSSTACLASS